MTTFRQKLNQLRALHRPSLALATLADHAADPARPGVQPLSDMRTHEEDAFRKALGIPSIFA